MHKVFCIPFNFPISQLFQIDLCLALKERLGETAKKLQLWQANMILHYTWPVSSHGKGHPGLECHEKNSMHNAIFEHKNFIHTVNQHTVLWNVYGNLIFWGGSWCLLDVHRHVDFLSITTCRRGEQLWASYATGTSSIEDWMWVMSDTCCLQWEIRSLTHHNHHS